MSIFLFCQYNSTLSNIKTAPLCFPTSSKRFPVAYCRRQTKKRYTMPLTLKALYTHDERKLAIKRAPRFWLKTDKEVLVSHSKIPRIFVQSLARRQPCCILNFDTRNFTRLRNCRGRTETNFYRPTQALFGAFPFFALSGDSPTASQKEKIPRKFLCGGCTQFLRYGFSA